MDAQRRTHRPALGDVAVAVVAVVVVGLAPVPGRLLLASAHEAAPAVVADDEAGQEVVHRPLRAAAKIERPLLGQGLPLEEELAVDEGLVGVLHHDPLVLRLHPLALAAATVPDAVADVDAVVQDIADAGLAPVGPARPGDAALVQDA